MNLLAIAVAFLAVAWIGGIAYAGIELQLALESYRREIARSTSGPHHRNEDVHELATVAGVQIWREAAPLPLHVYRRPFRRLVCHCGLAFKNSADYRFHWYAANAKERLDA